MIKRVLFIFFNRLKSSSLLIMFVLKLLLNNTPLTFVSCGDSVQGQRVCLWSVCPDPNATVPVQVCVSVWIHGGEV